MNRFSLAAYWPKFAVTALSAAVYTPIVFIGVLSEWGTLTLLAVGLLEGLILAIVWWPILFRD